VSASSYRAMVKGVKIGHAGKPFKCPGCDRAFSKKQHLENHLGKALAQKYRDGSLQQKDCLKNPRCKKVLKVKAGLGTMHKKVQKSFLPCKRTATKKVTIIKRGTSLVAANRDSKLPECILGIPSCERLGVPAKEVMAATAEVAALACVKQHFKSETSVQR